MCACGRPLHYSDRRIQMLIESMIRELGPTVKVAVLGHGAWLVPRHYIALHGIRAAELPELALTHGFEQVPQ